MYQSIDDISVDAYAYDEVCLNCRYWIADSEAMVCDYGKGFTNPDDSCCLFIAVDSMDDDYNSNSNKSEKMEIWKSSF